MTDATFPDDRLKSTNPTRQCQLVQLRLLKVFDAICRAHNLRYFLDFGTLLGAKRHGGAIPWDDDADVSMPIDDYNQFLKIAQSELPKDILLQSPTSNGGALLPLISRLRDTQSFFMDDMTCASVPSGIFLDIYPLRPDPKHFFNLHRHLFRLIEVSLATYGFHKTQLICSNNKFLYHWGMIFAWRTALITLFTLDASLSIFGTSGCSHPPSAAPIPFNLSKDMLFPLGEIKFEDHAFFAPHDVEGVLTKYFGDWKQLPPVNRRTGGHCLLLLPTQSPIDHVTESYMTEALDRDNCCFG